MTEKIHAEYIDAGAYIGSRDAGSKNKLRAAIFMHPDTVRFYTTSDRGPMRFDYLLVAQLNQIGAYRLKVIGPDPRRNPTFQAEVWFDGKVVHCR